MEGDPFWRRKRQHFRRRRWWSLCELCYVSVMMIAHGGIVPRRVFSGRWRSRFVCSGFVMQNSRRMTPSSPRLSSVVPSPSPAFARSFRSSTVLYVNKKNRKQQWKVGDMVATATANSATPETGQVVSVRGAGWYAIQLSSNGEIVRVRSSQLQSLDDESNSSNDNNSNNDSTTDNATAATTSNHTIGPTLEADPGRPPLYPPPPPLIQDLDALVREVQSDSTSSKKSSVEREFQKQVAHHSKCEKWVVFTDLHCCPATLQTCLQVLQVVHETALQHHAGVLFLGDFWHHRGTLRVDCLNAVLKAFETWKVSLVMIPGNHDQVTLGGHHHGLTPLANAYRVGGNNENDGDSVAGPLILSYPTVFRKGLFVPHIRDTATMESVLQSHHAKDATALFVHAEVKGALMNDLLISTHGIPPSSFPSHKPIYSGHFHKPHVVHSSSSGRYSTSVSVEYLGSPYEISLAEAEQEKQLVVLDEHWKCEKRIPLNLGRKHFKVSSWEELSLLQLQDDAEDSHRNPSTRGVKKGDRVVVSLPGQRRENPKDPSSNALLNDYVEVLRAQGVIVEVRENNTRPFSTMLPSSTANDPMPEEMSPESTWRAYLKDAEMRESIDGEISDMLLKTGLEILEEIEVDGIDRKQGEKFDLKLSNTTVHGFGPFRESVTYPLDSRGLVLLRGSNSESGSDSNGSGKSSLAMATLWALTGTLDTRRSLDMKVADVVNDDSKTARVTVEGFINDVPFVVSRTKTASRGDLFFQLDGNDMTTQSMKETQNLLEEKLGVDPDTLLRSIFHGQHGLNDLLEATDAKLKDELSLVVPVDLWQSASTIARAKARDAKRRFDELEGMRRLRTDDIQNVKNKIDQATATRDTKLLQFQQARVKLEQLLAELEQNLTKETFQQSSVDVKAQLDTLVNEIRVQSELLESKVKNRDSQLLPLKDKLEEAIATRDLINQEHIKQERKIAAIQVAHEVASLDIKKLEEKWNIDLSRGFPKEFVPPETCPTCLQPLLLDGKGHDHKNIEETIKEEVELAQKAMQSAEVELKDAKLKSTQLLISMQSHDSALQGQRGEISEISGYWDRNIKQLQDEIQETRETQSELTAQLSSFVKTSQLNAQKEVATAAFNMEQIAFQHASDVVEGLEADLQAAKDLQKQIEFEKDEQETKRLLLSDVADRCGQRGVQAFILQNVVDSLEIIAQRYLDYLSEGGQRLELSLDAGEKISRLAYVRGPDGDFKQRPLSTLSGGQWRRCSLALSFAFAELVARRGRLKSSLLVLDEPLTHLDRSGRTKFGEVVRRMIQTTTAEDIPVLSGLQFSTVILILQDLSAEELEEAFDRMDTVVRENGGSYVLLDEGDSR